MIILLVVTERLRGVFTNPRLSLPLPYILTSFYFHHRAFSIYVDYVNFTMSSDSGLFRHWFFLGSTTATRRSLDCLPLQRVGVKCGYPLRCRSSPRDHMTLVQRSLHWLPIHQHIHNTNCLSRVNAPDYITNLVTLTSATSGRSHLRSADSLAFDIPRTRTGRGWAIVHSRSLVRAP